MMIGRLIGAMVSALYFLSPVPTYWRIAMDGSTGERGYWPLICTLVSTMAWIMYGALTNQGSIVYVNIIGLGAHCIYLFIFLLHGPGAKRRQINRTLSLGSIGIFLFGPVTAYLFGWGGNIYVVGWLCLALNLITYAAPIIASKNALESRSIVNMPVLVPVMLTVNGASGTFFGFYGVANIDYFLLASKLLSLVIGSGLLMIYAYVKYILNDQPLR